MPPPNAVTLFPYSAQWALKANTEAKRILSGLKDNGIVVHHIGSTSIGNICAKPIIDLMPEVECLELLDQNRAHIESLGYEWWGEYGIANRRYCTLSDHNDRRLVHIHIFARGDRQIEKHLAFRDYLRAFPDIAKEYEHEETLSGTVSSKLG